MDTSNSYLIEAKKEYTSQLQQIISPRIYERFKFIFDETIRVIQNEVSLNQIQQASVVKVFQKQLTSIRDWNESSIIQEYERIQQKSKCNYLDKLIKAVMIANMKILSTIQYGRRKGKIQVNIPTPTHFIHKCYVECAKEIYKNPYIFDMSSKGLSSKEKHQNMRDSLMIIDNGIQSAIRQLLPIGDLLEQNFNSDAEGDDDDSSSSSSSSSAVSSRQSESESESEVEAEETYTSEGGGGDEEDEESTVSSASVVSSISSDSASTYHTLATKVEETLEQKDVDDIAIRIGDDRETQTMLQTIVEDRKDNHVVDEGEGMMGGGGGGGGSSALFEQLSNQKNIVNNPVIVSAPVLRASPPSLPSMDLEKPTETKEIVFTGKIPSHASIKPSGSGSGSGSGSVGSSTPKEKSEGGGGILGTISQIFNMSESIYPPKKSSEASVKSSAPVPQPAPTPAHLPTPPQERERERILRSVPKNKFMKKIRVPSSSKFASRNDDSSTDSQDFSF